MPLPLWAGVGPSCVALPAGPWPTILEFLIAQFPAIAAAEWKARMQRGEVVDAEGVPFDPAADYRPHCKIYYYRDVPDEPAIPFEENVLFRDENLVVADKPHFLPVVPSGRYLRETLLARLRRRLGIDTLAPVHRIDRETAGLVLFTIRPETRGLYQSLFRLRDVRKEYEALAPWRADLAFPLQYRSRLEPADAFMQMRETAGEPNTETTISLLERRAEWARYLLAPLTGRRHQLRVHMAALAMPILNDSLYPVLQPEQAVPDYSRPLQLLARSLEFRDPCSGQPMRFESRLRLQPL